MERRKRLLIGVTAVAAVSGGVTGLVALAAGYPTTATSSCDTPSLQADGSWASTCHFSVPGAVDTTETVTEPGPTTTVTEPGPTTTVTTTTPGPTITATVTTTATVTVTPTPTTTPPPPPTAFPDATNTGVPAGVTLHNCSTPITVAGTYDSCKFPNGVTINSTGVKITRSEIDGPVGPTDVSLHGVVFSDTTINCNCPSTNNNSTPTAVWGSDFTLLRVNLFNSGHGVAPQNNVVIQDSYIHGLGGNTSAHKDGLYVGEGGNVKVLHNNIECNDGSAGGCTSAIGLLSDFGTITNYTIDNNLLNTNGSYCFYGGGGPTKPYQPNHISFTNNHFGRKDNNLCGHYGPVTYFDSNAVGNVWSGNVWDDTGATVPPEN